ncbi:MAG: ABC transporter ATP-binding protein [Pseudomonadota bacterium]|nr:ABC transporter ATP-binding protein [Pseudomonadota bacterium]
MSVSLNNVTLSYARHPAVHHIFGSFETGSLTAVTGPNGAGKTTLLKAIAGVLRPDEGNIHIAGQRSAYLPQAADMQRDFPMPVLSMVCTGYWHKTGGTGAITPAMRQQASLALAGVGLAGFEDRQLSSLSAGQFQRALFARLIVQDAPLILLDEPFAAIDADSTAQLIDILLRWHKEKRTVICVLHDLDQISRYFPECLLLARECIAWGNTDKALSPENLLKARFFHAGWESSPFVCERAV